MGIEIKGFPKEGDIKKMFDAVPILERHQVGSKATRAGARPVLSSAKSKAKSLYNGKRTRQGWSRNMFRQKIDGGQGRSLTEERIWKTLGMVVRKYDRGSAIAVVGTRWPAGNVIHYHGPKAGGRRVFYWGRDAGRTKLFVDFLKQSFDETKQEQSAAIRESLKKSMRDIWERRA